MNKFYSHPLLKGLSILLLIVLSSTFRLSAQYRLVVDLNPSTNPELSPQKGFGSHDGNGTRTFFKGDNSELWTSDGSTAGTKIIRRFLFIHDCRADVGEYALKKTQPLETTGSYGSELSTPGLMSLTITVPVLVPSEDQSSAPEIPLLAEKNNLLPNATRRLGKLPPLPGTMSLTSCVPATVPSLFHSS